MKNLNREGFKNNNINFSGGAVMKSCKIFFLVAMVVMMAVSCETEADTVDVTVDQGPSSGVHKVINYNLKACYLPEYGGTACPDNYYCQYDFDVNDYVCLGVCYIEFSYEEYVDKDKDSGGKKLVKDLYKVVDTCADGWHCYVPETELKKIYDDDVYVGEEGKGLCQKNSQCNYDTDCSLHEVCYDAQCIQMTERCDEDIDCDGGEVCSFDGWCVTVTSEVNPPVNNDECEKDVDCKNGETCDGGKCVKEDEVDPPVVDGEVLKCTLECNKNGYQPLVWYGDYYNKDGKYMENNPGSFSVSKCDMCTWGQAEFHFNCYKGDPDSPSDWGYGNTADVSCEFDDADVDPDTSSLGGGKMKAVLKQIDCTTCW